MDKQLGKQGYRMKPASKKQGLNSKPCENRTNKLLFSDALQAQPNQAWPFINQSRINLYQIRSSP